MMNQSDQSPSVGKKVILGIGLVALALCVLGGLTVAYRMFVEGYMMR